MSRYTSRRRYNSTHSPFVFFFLLACFGILFAGCSSQPDESLVEKAPSLPDVIFSEKDLEKIEVLDKNNTVELQLAESGRIIPTLAADSSASSIAFVDDKMYPQFESMRTIATESFVVTNDFLNVRSAPKITAPLIATLHKGDSIQAKEFFSNAWVKITYNNQDAYVSKRYVAKIISEDAYVEDKKQYDGLYFVDFDFLNVRSSPDVDSEKVAELSGQTIIKPLSLDNVWARVQVDGKEGYISREYLTKFEPDYIVRQSKYILPIVTIDVSTSESVNTVTNTIITLKNAGKKIITFNDFYDLLQVQQTKDVRLEPNTVILAFINVTPDTINAVSDAVYAQNVKATIFIATKNIGINAITERKILNIMANGLDVQSATHTADDLRALTSDQVRLEVVQSKKILEEITKKPLIALGYPDGVYNDRIIDIAAKAGYLFGLTANPGIQIERQTFLSVPRIMVNNTTTSEDLLRLIAGQTPTSHSSSVSSL